MKSLKTRGALIVEYALLLAVCCILGVIYLDAAPGVRDGVGPIKTKTEKVLADANNGIKGDKPAGEEGNNTEDNNTEIPPLNSSFIFYDKNGKENTATVQKVGDAVINDFVRYSVEKITDNATRNHLQGSGKDNISSVEWDGNGNVTISFTDGYEPVKVSSINMQNADFVNNMPNNIGLLAANGGTVVYQKNQTTGKLEVVQGNESGKYTYFEVKGPNGTTTPIGYKP